MTKDQMIVIGGWFPDTNVCDSKNTQGQHNMNLGYNGERKVLWDKYDPKASTYFVPTPIISAIGGGYVVKHHSLTRLALTIPQTYWRRY